MSKRFVFEHSFIDAEGGYDGWGAVAVADFDGDGRPEFATGGKGGGFYHLYDFEPASGNWARHVLTDGISPQVGAAAADLDGDGRPELVCGEWGGDRLLWLTPPSEGLDGWSVHTVAEGLTDPHDILAADVNGDGRAEIIVRDKGGALRLFTPPADPSLPWPSRTVADEVPGDGTAVAAVSGAGMDIVTNAGWFENVRGDGSEWRRHPLLPDSLGWHPETRLVPADLDGDGQTEVVITESEVGPARLAILKQTGPGEPWRPQVVLPAELDIRALHSLAVADLDGDGRLEVFTAEMENGKTDGVRKRPRWWCLAADGQGGWDRHVLLDANLGTHCAAVADFDGDGRQDIVGKVWRANEVNGNGGRNHADFLRNLV